MEFKDYVRVLRQRGWLIILLAVLTAGAAFGFSKLQTPVYKASIRLLITSRPDFGQNQAVRSLQRDFAAWLQSSIRSQKVIDELHLDMTPQELLADMHVAAASSESIIQIDIENTNLDVAKDIATVWAQQLIDYRTEQNAGLRREDQLGAEPIDFPIGGLKSPKISINTAAGAIFGALLGVVSIFVIEWIQSGVVHRAEDVERYLDLPVVGTIPGN